MKKIKIKVDKSGKISNFIDADLVLIRDVQISIILFFVLSGFFNIYLLIKEKLEEFHYDFFYCQGAKELAAVLCHTFTVVPIDSIGLWHENNYFMP